MKIVQFTFIRKLPFHISSINQVFWHFQGALHKTKLTSIKLISHFSAFLFYRLATLSSRHPSVSHPWSSHHRQFVKNVDFLSLSCEKDTDVCKRDVRVNAILIWFALHRPSIRSCQSINSLRSIGINQSNQTNMVCCCLQAFIKLFFYVN